ncbi:RNA polymerase sigma factor SigM [uncultured Nocardioides sp.]|uniref:RNA polymerase sigma factor SigM n=1 Tax=uncultured Nocardioides sp. TaxID=198441 RepID=UPI0026275F9D|nr:RNA polymerase sigma factor SigM [uncultured Nocardioides sp.]
MSTSTGPEAPTDWSALEDRALLAAHVEGRDGAFAELFRRHRDRLWAVALRTTGNPEDAADGLQDGMIAAYRRAGSFRGDAAVTTWLHRVVVNACLDRLRAAKVRRAQPLPEDLEEYGARLAGPREEAAPEQPDAAAVRADERRLVLGALAALPADQRAALVLVDMEGYPVAEAAVILGCAVGTVKSRCSRGRARLATVLAPLLADIEAGERGHARSRNPSAEPDVGPTDARGPPTPQT